MSLTSQFIQRTYRQPYRPSVAGKRADALPQLTADSYNDFIWSLARKFTNSRAEAEAAAQEIFTDIRRFIERGPHTQSFEDRLVARVALRRLLKFLE
jgi:hypothetical protein